MGKRRGKGVPVKVADKFIRLADEFPQIGSFFAICFGLAAAYLHWLNPLPFGSDFRGQLYGQLAEIYCWVMAVGLLYRSTMAYNREIEHHRS